MIIYKPPRRSIALHYQIIFSQVTRYQSDPGQATAYMIGQLDIIKSRRYAEKHLKDDFTLPDFHYQVKT